MGSIELEAGAVSSSDDEVLMLACAKGEMGAFETLYRRHKDPLYRFLLRNCRSQPVAEELLQDVWLKLYRNRAGYYVGAKFTTYLYQIARTRLIDHYRTNPPDAIPVDDLLPSQEPVVGDRPEESVAVADETRRLHIAIARLPLEQREVILLRLEKDMSAEEIAQVVKVSINTVKSRLRYAIAKLKQEMA